MFGGIALAAAKKRKLEMEKVVKHSEPDERKIPKESDPEPDFPCLVCPSHFNRKFNRDRHMEVMHKVPRQMLRVRKTPKPAVAMPEDNTQKEVQTDETRMEVPTIDDTPPLMIVEEDTNEEPWIGKQPSEPHTSPVETEVTPKTVRKPTLEIQTIKTTKFKETSTDKASTNICSTSQAKLVKIPIDNGMYGPNMTPSLTIHFCGKCDYPTKHKYCILSNGHAVLMVPTCDKCKELNLLISKTVQKFRHKEDCEHKND